MRLFSLFLFLSRTVNESTSASSLSQVANSESTTEATTEESTSIELTEIDQLIKPSKIHVQPLHADDLLYESNNFDPSAGTSAALKAVSLCVETDELTNKTNTVTAPARTISISAKRAELNSN